MQPSDSLLSDRRRIAILALAVLLLSTLPVGSADAYFERIQAGSRATAMARAYGAIADDASALYWNPAAMVVIPRREAMVMYSKPFAVPNLQANYVGLVWPRDDVSLGLAWHHTGVDGVYGEDIIVVGAARDLLPPGGDIAIAAGGNLKLLHAGFSAQDLDDYGRKVKLSADLATLVNLGEKLTASCMVRDLFAPDFDFVEGNGGTRVERTYDLGLAYRWHTESTYAMSFSRNMLGDWDFHLGSEVWFYKVFGLRSGFTGEDFAGGVGLKTERYLVDFSFITHDELGVSYELSLRVPFGRSRW